MLPSAVTILRRGGTCGAPLAYTERATSGAYRHYVVGFPHAAHARIAQRELGTGANMRLQRSMFSDVTADVNSGLRAFGVEPIDGSIVLDSRARLVISKCGRSELDASLVSMEDFLMYPFDLNVGIIMPYDMESEDSCSITLLASVVESAGSVKALRSSLDRMMQL